MVFLSFDWGLLFIIAAALALVALCLCAIAFTAFKMIVGRHAMDPANPFYASLLRKLLGDYVEELAKYIEEESERLLALPHEDVTVTTDDGLKLMGRFFENSVQTDKTVVCMHGYTSDGKRDFAAIAQFYLDEGYNVLLPEHRAHGRSEGKYIGFGVLDRRDALKWLKLVTDKYPNGKIVLTGISMGGATVLQTLDLELPDNVKAVIADCPFTSVKAELSFQIKRLFHLPPFPLVNLTGAVCKRVAGYSFDEVDSKESVKYAKVPVLFIHGGADAFVPLFMSEECFAHCPTEKKFVLVEGAAHGSSHFKNKGLYESSVREFLTDKF
ncbi:MAG: alpha/beta hydrolase [Clostridiales bacterium]|jgi:fermentation-respiration switch protein FrsA (DUF1100 family)|nr:alpha/beta hydrolase [Clostridiales bacterium]